MDKKYAFAVVGVALAAFYLYGPTILEKESVVESELQKSVGAMSAVSTADVMVNSDQIAAAEKNTLNKSLKDKVAQFSDGDDFAGTRAVLFEYLRSGNHEDTIGLIKKAFERKLITPNEYYGELAHVLSISYDKPKEIVDEILKSDNGYGKEVLFSHMATNSGIYEGMSAVERADVLGLLKDSRPQFDVNVGELGLVNVYRYENWLQSIKMFQGNENNFYTYLNDLVSTGLKDPREVVAMMYTIPKNELESHLRGDSVSRLRTVANDYKESYPNNQVSNFVFRKYETEK